MGRQPLVITVELLDETGTGEPPPRIGYWTWRIKATWDHALGKEPVPRASARGMQESRMRARIAAVEALADMLGLGVDIAEGWLVLSGTGAPMTLTHNANVVRVFPTAEAAEEYTAGLDRRHSAHQVVPIKLED